MGVNPDLDDDTEILNGGFDDALNWTIDHDWAIAAGVAHATNIIGGGGAMWQNSGFQKYFRYQVTFTILNFNIADPPDRGLRVIVGGEISGLYNANGIFTYEVTAANDVGQILFAIDDIEPGDSFDLDNVSLLKIENYVEDELEILVREPKRASTVVAVATDYYSSLSCRDDNSSCLISYDI